MVELPVWYSYQGNLTVPETSLQIGCQLWTSPASTSTPLSQFNLKRRVISCVTVNTDLKSIYDGDVCETAWLVYCGMPAIPATTDAGPIEILSHYCTYHTHGAQLWYDWDARGIGKMSLICQNWILVAWFRSIVMSVRWSLADVATDRVAMLGPAVIVT